MIGSSDKLRLRYSASLKGASTKDRPPLMRISIWMACAVVVLGFVSGCGNRTIFVPESSPMRIAEAGGVRMHVFHRIDGVWTRSTNEIVVPEGWYLLPPSFVSPEVEP